MRQKNKHLIAAAIFIAIAFFVLPEILPKIALNFSPGGLRLPESTFLNVGLLAAILVIAVFLKNYDKLDSVRGPKLWEFGLFGALTVVFFGWYTGLLFAIVPNLFTHLMLAGFAFGGGLLFLLLTLFGLKVFKTIMQDMAVSAVALIFYTGITLFIDTTRFHYITAKVTYWIMDPFFSIVFRPEEFAPYMRVDSFAVLIGPSCSGIFSMVLFTALFSFVYWMDKDKITNKKRALIVYLIGLAGAFILNLLRLVVLLIIGALWDPDFAIGAFHGNAGWILFAGYSFVYWWMAYPYLVDKKKKKTKKPKSI